MSANPVPPIEADDSAPVPRADATRIEGSTRGGKPCALIDNTGDRLPRTELEGLLADLVESDAFGFRALSQAGGSTIALERMDFGHVQVAGRLYRLLLSRGEARLEPF